MAQEYRATTLPSASTEPRFWWRIMRISTSFLRQLSAVPTDKSGVRMFDKYTN
jgi:hypothetical protein